MNTKKKKAITDEPSSSSSSAAFPEKKRKVEKEGINERNVGLIFNYGLHSVPAFDVVSVAKKRPWIKGSEWYAARLETQHQKMSAVQETKAYHQKVWQDKVSEYDDFLPHMKPHSKCVEEWINLAVAVQANYAILTVKHFDGFCLWPTETTSLALKTRDLIAEFKAACQAHNIKFGIAYTWGRFRGGNDKSYADKMMKPQIMELLKYKPDIWHFDGDWFCHSKYAKKAIHDSLKIIRQQCPDVKINDCTAEIEHFQSDCNWLGEWATHRTLSGRGLFQKVGLSVPWEYQLCLGHSWGYNAQQTPADLLQPTVVQQTLQNVNEQKGQLLVNIGINSLGQLNPDETIVLLKALAPPPPLSVSSSPPPSPHPSPKEVHKQSWCVIC
jgi:alpha-L-fucosidase